MDVRAYSGIYFSCSLKGALHYITTTTSSTVNHKENTARVAPDYPLENQRLVWS